MATYTLPELRYDYSALEPHISGRIMELHHDKHHAAYVKGANTALDRIAEARDKGHFDDIGALEKAPRVQPVGPRSAFRVLAEHGPEGGRAAAGRAGVRDHRRVRELRHSPEADERRRGEHHGLRLGGARVGSRSARSSS